MHTYWNSGQFFLYKDTLQFFFWGGGGNYWMEVAQIFTM